MADNIKFIDTHAHLYDKAYNDFDQIVQNSKQNNISKVIMPNIDLNTIDQSLKISKKYPNFSYSMLGLHPCDVDENYKEVLKKLEEYFTKYNFCGIGEIGLDFYRDTSKSKYQIEAFKIQIKWAIIHNLPIVLHCRSALKETLEILNKEYNGKKIKGILHCFGGSLNEANEIINLGLHLGIGGILTFKNSKLKEVIKEIDLEHIVLETDAPYLSPEPLRGKTNEPANLNYTAKELAKLKNIDLKDLAFQTTQNALKIFNLDN